MKNSQSLHPTQTELDQRNSVLQTLRNYIANDRTIPVLKVMRQPTEFALLSLARQQSPFTGSVCLYSYLFEGEDDLLHLFVVKRDGGELTVEEAQSVVSFLLPTVPPALIWIKPGTISQHFYLAHDLLLD